MGLKWIGCPQHQIEVKKAFPENAHLQLKFFFFHQGRFSLICSCLKTAWAIDTRLVSNGRLFVIFSLKSNLAPMTLAVKISERFMKKLPWWKKWIIELKVKILILLQTDVMNKHFNSDQWIFYTKNVRYSTLRKKWFQVMKIMHLKVKAFFAFESVHPVLRNSHQHEYAREEEETANSHTKLDLARNKPDRATMRPDCVFLWFEHITYIERQMDELTDESTEK